MTIEFILSEIALFVMMLCHLVQIAHDLINVRIVQAPDLTLETILLDGIYSYFSINKSKSLKKFKSVSDCSIVEGITF